MTSVVVIGDELNSAGFRLAGVQTRNPAAVDLQAEFAQALQSAALVVLTQASAAALPSGALARARARLAPLVVVVPDIRSPQADTGTVSRIRAALGIPT